MEFESEPEEKANDITKLSQTRWTVRATCMPRVIDNFETLMKACKRLANLTIQNWRPSGMKNGMRTFTKVTQYELCQEESDLLKAGFHFSIQPDKSRKSEIFTTFEKIHRSFLNNLKSEETKSQIKAHFSYLVNSYLYNYKPSPRILRQHRVLRNLRKNKDIVITKPDKGNGVVILDRKLYNNAIEEIISDSSKFI